MIILNGKVILISVNLTAYLKVLIFQLNMVFAFSDSISAEKEAVNGGCIP